MICCVCGHEKFEHNNTIGGGTSCFIAKCGCQQFVPVSTFSDPINPSHYKQGTIECIDAIRAALTSEEFRGFLKGQIIKYVWRMNHKGGKTDLEKSIWYADKLLEVMSNECTGSIKDNN